MMTAQQFYLWQSCGLFLCAGLGWLLLAQMDFAESRLGKLVIRLAGATWVAYAGLVFLEVVWTCGPVTERPGGCITPPAAG